MPASARTTSDANKARKFVAHCTILGIVFMARSPALHGYRAAQLFRQQAPDQLQKRFACFFQNEGARGIRPAQLEAGGQRGSPDLTQWRIRTDDKLGFFR